MEAFKIYEALCVRRIIGPRVWIKRRRHSLEIIMGGGPLNLSLLYIWVIGLNWCRERDAHAVRLQFPGAFIRLCDSDLPLRHESVRAPHKHNKIWGFCCECERRACPLRAHANSCHEFKCAALATYAFYSYSVWKRSNGSGPRALVKRHFWSSTRSSLFSRPCEFGKMWIFQSGNIEGLSAYQEVCLLN